jgi:hypothetical protein
LQHRFAGRDLVIRNLCDDGDTPGYRDHSGRNSPYAYPDAEKFHPLSKAKDRWGSGHAGSGFAETPDQWLTGLKADIVLAWFGYAESFKGDAGLADFLAELDDAVLGDPAIHALAARVGYRPDPSSAYPQSYSGALEIVLRDGRRIECRQQVNRGASGNPLDATDIVEKFRDNAARALPAARVR